MDIIQQLNQVASEREIAPAELLHDVEEALAVAYKKHVGAIGEVRVHVDPKVGYRAVIEKEVVGEASDPAVQISIADAKKRKADVEIGDFLPVEVDPNRFGRIAAATFKQVLNQKLRESETRAINEVFQEKMNNIVTGVVTRREAGSVIVQVDKVEAELPAREQVGTEPYRQNDRLKLYVVRVDENGKRLRVIVSRTHKNLLRRLFELEVPEISDGTVEIKSVARDPGQRSKLAVFSTDERVDPIGACVGPRGARVQSIVDELYEEKIDIVPFSDDPKKFIENALGPAKVNSIRLYPDERKAYVVVPDGQLSLAIGKGGQNVRLASKLTEWAIDIRSEAQAASEGKK